MTILKTKLLFLISMDKLESDTLKGVVGEDESPKICIFSGWTGH